MSWRLAKSIEILRNQLNKQYPNRDKTSDGGIGDTSHAHTSSDHNPNDAGVVCAYDIDTDLNGNINAHDLADYMRLHRHPDLKYIISNKRICSPRDGWAWRVYGGADPHTSHIHISVGVGSDGKSEQPYDDMFLWDIGNGADNNGNYETKVVKVKATDIEYAIVKVKTGTNGAGQTIIRLSRGGLIMIGHAWMGNSAKGLSCAFEQKDDNQYAINVEGAPGAYTISVNVAFA